jgi:hypothetical protein
MGDDATPIPIARFPFAMILTSNFLQGAMFLCLSGPLIILIASTQTPRLTSMAELFTLGYPVVVDVLQGVKAEALSVSLIVIACFVVGTLSTIIDRVVAIFICAPLNFLAGIKTSKTAGHDVPYFTSREMAGVHYPRFLSWLMQHPSMQAHWEWDLFHYYLRWTVVTQVGMFFVFSWFLIAGRWSLSWWIPLGLCVIVLVTVAVQGSLVMRRVHCFYLEKADEEPASQASGSTVAKQGKGAAGTAYDRSATVSAP